MAAEAPGAETESPKAAEAAEKELEQSEEGEPAETSEKSEEGEPVFKKTAQGAWQTLLYNTILELPECEAKKKLAKQVRQGPGHRKQLALLFMFGTKQINQISSSSPS